MEVLTCTYSGPWRLCGRVLWWPCSGVWGLLWQEAVGENLSHNSNVLGCFLSNMFFLFLLVIPFRCDSPCWGHSRPPELGSPGVAGSGWLGETLSSLSTLTPGQSGPRKHNKWISDENTQQNLKNLTSLKAARPGGWAATRGSSWREFESRGRRGPRSGPCRSRRTPPTRWAAAGHSSKNKSMKRRTACLRSDEHDGPMSCRTHLGIWGKSAQQFKIRLDCFFLMDSQWGMGIQVSLQLHLTYRQVENIQKDDYDTKRDVNVYII